MKIVHLITDLSTGGAEKMLAKLLSGMDHSRFRNVVVSLTDRGVLGDSIRALGVPLHTLGMGRGRPSPLAAWRLWYLLRRERPVLLQTWLYHADLLGLICGRLAGIPRIVWNLRCSNMDMGQYSALSALVVRVLARLSQYPDAVLVNSETGRQVHEQLGYRPRHWELIPNGFDLDRFRPDPDIGAAFRRELNIPAGSFLVGMVARLDPMKDHGTFLKAATLLSRDHPEARFVLVGRDVRQGNEALVRLVKENGLDGRVHLLGERTDVERILPGLDLATLTSAFGEGFPNVLGEAMACGLPCVATDVGDAGAIIGDTGLLVPPRDPMALATAWWRVLDLGPEGRAQLGALARRRVEEHYSLVRVIRRYETLYEEMAGQVAAH